MMRSRLFALVLCFATCLGAAGDIAEARCAIWCLGSGKKVTPPTLDGSVRNNNNSTTVTASLTTTKSNDVIILAIEQNALATTLVADVAGLSWTARCTAGTGNNLIKEYWAIAASPLSGDVITVTVGSSTFISIAAYGVNGAHTAAPFDGSCVTSLTDPASITTTHPVAMIIGAARMSSPSSPTQGAGYTLIFGFQYLLTEYQAVTTTQSGLSVTIGTGAGGSNGMIADAIIAGP